MLPENIREYCFYLSLQALHQLTELLTQQAEITENEIPRAKRRKGPIISLGGPLPRLNEKNPYFNNKGTQKRKPIITLVGGPLPSDQQGTETFSSLIREASGENFSILTATVPGVTFFACAAHYFENIAPSHHAMIPRT